ncbi:meso-butanediol dehydrogenase/(S,S)-butanediol dehydrogenase/diacetyl reductase [Bradyrhizobium elkanii]|uniref:Meso-butanediol dehydrogenase/(S,S)-butanediol dehydrogenase/diacetyl reductase n=1 Tax=Bradyrhizobium elkanii TaxID=29448 RepID=A0A8I1Y992_BRAEL|nr:meso-butanediol dehydrogenase/(S,S)-butanediol dehydrogenase/diacetyl reductase [Bradyrhizobium elkanii]
MTDRFHGKVIIVTGAASGIGEATARRFVVEGAKVAMIDRDEASLEKVTKSLPADQVMVQAADVSDSRAVDEMVAAVVGGFGRLDVIVNNAGVHEGGDPASITDEKWRKVMSTDIDGVFYGCRAALPHLENTKGSIVNTASVSGTGGDWGMSPYNAAKGAVVDLTRALALDLGKKGIRVNAVCPSLTRTGMTEDMMDDNKLLAKFAERILLGRVCEPQEVAAVIAFLTSDDASFMTGANVAVDGGVSASDNRPRNSSQASSIVLLSERRVVKTCVEGARSWVNFDASGVPQQVFGEPATEDAEG